MTLASAASAAPTADRIVRHLSRCDSATRKDITEALGLPTATVVGAAAKLLEAGVVIEHIDPSPRGKSGRPPGRLQLARRRPVLGFVGWERGRLTASVITYDAHVIARTTLDVGMRPERVDALDPALDFLRNGVSGGDPDRPYELTGVVIGVPAPFQRGTGLPSSRTSPVHVLPRDADVPQFAPWLRADPVAALTDRIEVPVLVENNANLAAVGEFSAGVAAGHRDLVYVAIGGRGVGAGMIIDGRLHRGASGFAGELGHIHVDDNGPLCACGGRGCLSGMVGAALLNTVQPLYDEPVTMADIVRLAEAGEPGPVRVLSDLGRIIGRRLADLCTFVNPSAVVVGGMVGAAGSFVADGIREQIDLYAAPMVSAAVRTMTSDLGERAELLGALHLARNEL